jgi:hypothetical protein
MADVTEYYSWPKLEQGSENWLTVMNGWIDEVDYLLKAAHSTVVSDGEVVTSDGEVVFSVL